jgi:hypothetical protein
LFYFLFLQSEIEMLKYELNELKMTSTIEVESLKKSLHDTQTMLDKERDENTKELAASKSELFEFKTLYKKTKDELDVDRAELKQSVRIIIKCA